MRATLLLTAAAAAAVLAPCGAASPQRAPPPRMSAVSANDAATRLSAAHAAAAARLVDELDMRRLPYAEELGFGDFELGAVAGRVESYDAPAAKVAWCSSLTLRGAGGFSTGAIAVWNAPAVEVPHLHLQAGVSDGGVDLELDFRPRLNAGYEAADADGGFAPPGTREAFAQASLRATYDDAFFTAEARAWRAAVAATAGATPRAAAAEVALAGRRQFGGDGLGVSSGPLQLCLRLPLTDDGVGAACGACAAATERWLGWAREAPPASWMANRMMYDRDSATRQQLLAASARALAGALGGDRAAAAALAQAHAGRLDMMGHNMMQESSGFGSDPDEGRD